MPTGERWAREGDDLRMQVLRWIEIYAAEHGEFPRPGQVAEHFGRSRQIMHKHLRVLEDQGFIRRERTQVVKL